MDVWKNLEGYEGIYEVNKSGLVKSLGRYHLDNVFYKGKILKPIITNYGYACVSLWKDGKPKKIFIHVLVAKTFIPNPENKPFVNHINGIKHDNRVENLEWCTKSENALHSFHVLGQTPWSKGKIGYTRVDSRQINQFNLLGHLIETHNSIRNAARKTNTAFANIDKCIKGKRKTAGGFIWKLKNP